VLACACFGDDALLSHADRQQRLTQTIIDLVRTGMQQVFALKIYLCSAQFPA
jgi:hypothetical protein